MPDDIITTVGASEALSFTMNSICDPGDEVIIPEPFYANYNGFAHASDVNVIPITSKIEDNFALPPIDSFREKINKKTKAIIICNPCNPTGYVYSKDEIIDIANLAKKHDLFIVVDEVYREFIYTDIKHFSILEVNRYPVSGEIVYSKHHTGDYLVAWHPKSSLKNERTTVVINNKKFGEVLYRQIAGAVARRIVNYATTNTLIEQGEDSGFIKFGSRVDLFLPLESEIKVKVGDRVSGGMSVIV